MQDDSTVPYKHTPRKYISGGEKRRRRQARGLPPYTPAGLAARARDIQKKGKYRSKQYYEKRRHQLIARRDLIHAIKLERGCADCGYADHAVALDFDHLPGFEKLEGISYIPFTAPVEYLLAEIAKCEVVCANCHRVRTARRRDAARAGDASA